MVEENEHIDIDKISCESQLREWIVKCSDLITIYIPALMKRYLITTSQYWQANGETFQI